MPPAGAAAASVTVAVAFACPPTTVPGVISRLEIVPSPGACGSPPDAGFTINPALTLFAEVAVIVAVRAFVTAEVLTPKFALVAPEGMMSDAGTVTPSPLAVKFTRTPEAPAGAASVTVPVELCPPCTEFGVSVRLCTMPVPGPVCCPGRMVNTTVEIKLPLVADIVTSVGLLTGGVAIPT